MPELSELSKHIVEMWNKGMSGGDIAARLGMSRSAIMGRVDRLRASGFELRSAPAPQEQHMKVKIEKKTKLGWKTIYVVPENPTVIEDKRFVGILELKMKSCRYVVGNDKSRGHLYCGAVIEKGSYCGAHYDLCYIRGTGISNKILKRMLLR